MPLAPVPDPRPAEPVTSDRPRASRTARRDARVAWTLAAVIALVVFLIDALTPLDIAIAVLYVVVVLLVASTGNRRRRSRPRGAASP